MTSEELLILQKFEPKYFFDGEEKYLPANYSEFVTAGKAKYDSTVVGNVTYVNGKTRLHYFLYYTEDGGLEYFEISIGNHVYDIEHLIIEIDPKSSTIIGILFRPHGSSEHFWIRNPEDIKQIGEQHPKVYVSRGKHAQYPISGTVFRYMGGANDSCDAKVYLDTAVVQVNPDVLKASVGGVMKSLRSRSLDNTTQFPSVKLKDVKLRMLLKKFW
jgi:hypothetical protein